MATYIDGGWAALFGPRDEVLAAFNQAAWLRKPSRRANGQLPDGTRPVVRPLRVRPGRHSDFLPFSVGLLVWR